MGIRSITFIFYFFSGAELKDGVYELSFPTSFGVSSKIFNGSYYFLVYILFAPKATGA